MGEGLAKAQVASRAEIRDPALVAGETRLRHLLEQLGTRAAAGTVSPFCDWEWASDSRGSLNVTSGSAPSGFAGTRLASLAPTASGLASRIAERWAFRDAVVAPDGSGGTARWRMSATPQFDRDGRFSGYRGVGWNLAPADAPWDDRALAEYAHEIRSPLNAISGIAQLVETATLGPVAGDAMATARRIVAETERIVAALDDLTDRVRLDGNHYPVDGGWFAIGSIRDGLLSRYSDRAGERGVRLKADDSAELRVWGDPRSFERAAERLLAGLLPFAGASETLHIEARRWGDLHGGIVVSRPAALRGQSGASLLDSNGGGMPGAPLLGLSFTLRLVDQLMRAMGGEFRIGAARFRLRLPLSSPQAVVPQRVAIAATSA